jgi:parallel beta-helix repeat protein
MRTHTNTKLRLALVVGLALFAGLKATVLAGTFAPVTVMDQTPTAPLANPDPSSFQPRYISGFGSDDAFTVFFEDRDASNAISYASTATGPTGFPSATTATNIADTHFCVKDWPITIGGTDYAYRAWGAVGNNTQHRFYVSNDLTNWTLVSTFTIPNAPEFTDAHGWVYYGFHDVILLNGTYYAFAESNQSQTMLVRSANGDDVWEAFASIGGRPGWGPLELPAGVSYGWTPSGNFLDLGHDRGYGKVYVDPRDSNFYLAVNTAAKASLPPADLEAAFINPANWTWHDGTTGPATGSILSETSEHDLRECWVVPQSDPDAPWVIVYDADFGSADGGKALGYATLSPPAPPPETVWVDDDWTSQADVDALDPSLTWQYDAFSSLQDGVDAVAEGGTVNVVAGTYDSSGETFPIVIHKSLTLLGAQATVDPRPSQGGRSGSESTIDADETSSAVIRVSASDVEINGFTITGGTGDMVEESGSADNLLFRYNILYDDLSSSGDEAIQIKYSTGVVMEYNYAYNILQDAFNLSASSDGVVRHNEAHDIYSENAAIYCYDETNIDIIGNLVYNVPVNDGIKLGDSSDGSTGGIVRENEVHDAAEDGITIYASGVAVEYNTIYNCGSENGALYLYGADNSLVLGNSIYDNDAIGLLVRKSSNVAVEKNGFYNNDDSDDTKYVGSAGIWLTSDASSVEIHSNCIAGNADFGAKNEAATLVDADYNWWGDASGPYHPTSNSGGLGDPVSDNVDFYPWLEQEPYCGPDHDGPVTSNLVADPNPVAVGNSVDLYANVDDTDTGGSNIASAEYSLDGGEWNPMDASDEAFDAVSEDVTAGLAAPGTPGIYDLCVRGTDAAENTGPEECVMLVVYDPDGGFVTGGGWITSPPGTYMAPPYSLQTFDTAPPLSDSAVEGAWYPDRYRPAAFESAFFDDDNRLHVLVDGDDQYPHGEHTTFYNFQGRKFNLGYGLDTYIMADLYIGGGWETEDRHASLWATTHDADGVISGYPIIGFTSGKGFRIFSQDTDQNTSNGYQAGWYDIGFPEGFEYGAWYSFQAALTESAYHYYINGDLVWTDIVTYDSVLWANMMLQAYNYGEDYDVYWDNVGAGPMGPIGKASFGFVSKYKKGASEPTGNTEFVFKAADLNFHSTSYDWLVVTGSDYAKFKGSGTINGANATNGEPYKFQLWAGDGDPDTFRIKIWWEDADEAEHVVYDNGMDQAIGGGNIVVHKK